jgi:hypothetical protein
MRGHDRQQRQAQRPGLYQEITDKIIAQIEVGILPWVQPWAGGPALSVPVNHCAKCWTSCLADLHIDTSTLKQWKLRQADCASKCALHFALRVALHFASHFALHSPTAKRYSRQKAKKTLC